jgi:hypothetical protein
VFAVDVAAMTQTEDKNDKLCVVDLVDDAVVASTHSPFARAADQLCRCGRTRIGAQQLDRRLQTAPYLGVELA